MTLTESIYSTMESLKAQGITASRIDMSEATFNRLVAEADTPGPKERLVAYHVFLGTEIRVTK